MIKQATTAKGREKNIHKEETKKKMKKKKRMIHIKYSVEKSRVRNNKFELEVKLGMKRNKNRKM